MYKRQGGFSSIEKFPFSDSVEGVGHLAIFVEGEAGRVFAQDGKYRVFALHIDLCLYLSLIHI